MGSAGANTRSQVPRDPEPVNRFARLDQNRFAALADADLASISPALVFLAGRNPLQACGYFSENTLSAFIITNMLREIFPFWDQDILEGAAFSEPEKTDVPVALENATKNRAGIESIFHSTNSRQWESRKIKMKSLPCRGSAI
jgi:hypothetical protein